MLDSIGLFILDGNWIAGMMLAIYKMCPVWFAGFEIVSKFIGVNIMCEIKRARHIKKTLGTKIAARYLCLREYSLEAALWILLGK